LTTGDNQSGIRFWNILFKADKRISHHLGLTGYFLLTELEYYSQKINRLLLHFGYWKRPKKNKAVFSYLEDII